MTIKFRFALLLGVFLMAFAVAIAVLRRIERSDALDARATVSRDRAATVERWLELSGQPLRQFANDYSLWDELVAFVQEPDPAWAQINLITSLNTFDASAYWVLGPEGEVVHHARREATAPLSPPLRGAPWLALTTQQRFPWFFFEADGQLFEGRGAPIQPSDDVDRDQPARGWFIVARRWDQDHLEDLGRLVGLRATLVPRRKNLPAPASLDALHLERPLEGVDGRPVRILQLQGRSLELSERLASSRRRLGIFGGFGLVVIAGLALTLQRWVLRPLNRLQAALAQGRPAPLGRLEDEGTEFGRLAQLVTSSFVQRDALERQIDERARMEAALRQSETTLRSAIDERVRLGRDLHDSVIQSIYASGLALAGAQRLIPQDPAEAERRLEQVRLTLNDTIRDLRAFITGLEPETLGRMSLTEAVRALVELLRAATPLQVALDINEAVAEELTPTRRAELLQIIREAISNVVRHGQATQAHVAVLADGDQVTLVIADNGRGFDPQDVRQDGQGLANMVERAQAAEATLRLESTPGKGTRVVVSFPLTNRPQ